MRMRYDWEVLDINGSSVEDAILALQTWQAENPDAVDTCFNVCYDGDSGYTEISFHRSMTEMELRLEEIQQANAAEYREERDRKEYERLKAKYEGN